MVSTRIVFVLLAMSLLIGCVTPDGSGSGNTASGSVKGKSSGTINVCGETFALGDLLQHPVFRQAFTQFITLQQLFAEASKQGITITDEELNAAIDEQKKQIEESGQSWDDFLEMQGLSLDELKQMLKTQKLFEKLMDAKLDFSDENLKEYFDKNKDAILNQHIQTNFLPETERATLTWESCKETTKELMRSQLGFTHQQEIMDSLMLNATIDLSGALPADKAKEIEQILLGKEQEAIRERNVDEGVGVNEGAGAAENGETAAPAGETGEAPAAAGEGAAPEGETPEPPAAEAPPAETK